MAVRPESWRDVAAAAAAACRVLSWSVTWYDHAGRLRWEARGGSPADLGWTVLAAQSCPDHRGGGHILVRAGAAGAWVLTPTREGWREDPGQLEAAGAGG